MAGNRTTFNILMKSARKSLDDSDFERTIADYTAAIERKPDNKVRLAEAYNGRGVAKFRLGRHQEAIEDCTKAMDFCSEVIRLDPKNATAWNYRGFAKVSLSHHQEAIEDCTKAIEINPADKNVLSSAYNNRGAAKYGLGRHEEAITDCTKAIGLKPADKSRLAEAYNDRSAAKNEIRDHQGAIEDSTKAIELNPKNAAAWDNRGFAKGGLGRYEEALADCTEAIRIEPKNATAWSNRGTVKAYLEDFDGAIKDVEEALRLSPDNPRFLNNRAAIKAEKSAREAVEKRIGALEADTDEVNDQAEEYKREEEANRDGAYFVMGCLVISILLLVELLILPNLSTALSSELKSIDLLKFFGLLPLISIIILIISPLVWLIRLLLAEANSAKIMQAEYRHFAHVEKKMFFYFAKDDTDEGKKIRADYIKATMTNSPSDKLVALQSKTSAPSPNPAQNIVENIVNKVRSNPPS